MKLMKLLPLALSLRLAACYVGQDCGHGVWQPNLDGRGSCQCDAGWTHAGPTDTFNWLKGACYQFQCSSGENCQRLLGVDGAECEVPGWDGSCGWSYAWGNFPRSLLGPGYSTDDAACMGLLYTAFVSLREACAFLAKKLFWVFGLLACVMLPFGQTKVRCRCREKTLLKFVKDGIRITTDCDGHCTKRASWSQEIAWSIYMVELYVWSLVFLLTVWGAAMTAWLGIISLAVLLMLIIAVVVSILACICSVMGAGGGTGEISCDCLCQGSGGGDCCSSCDGCLTAFCDDCCPYNPNASFSGDTTWWYFYGGGPQVDGQCCDCNCCNGCNVSCGKFLLCRPIAWMFLYFPRHPDNLWGGVFGCLILGTHPRSPCPYQGGNRLTDLFGMRGRRDLHRNREWRNRFWDYLNRVEEEPTRPAEPRPAVARPPTRPAQPAPRPRPAAPVQQDMFDADMRLAMRLSAEEEERARNRRTFGTATEVAGRRIIPVAAHFDRVRDNCVGSSWEDYESGECWVCCEKNVAPTWDLWLQCGHMFCSKCSSEMMRRQIPCPLCRRISFQVKRAPARYCSPVVAPAP